MPGRFCLCWSEWSFTARKINRHARANMSVVAPINDRPLEKHQVPDARLAADALAQTLFEFAV
jgi:hypothetical protein